MKKVVKKIAKEAMKNKEVKKAVSSVKAIAKEMKSPAKMSATKMSAAKMKKC